jgi:protein-serine/threonine kinase
MGSGSGASEVKQHKWFSNISWGLLRHMTPPIIPAESNGIDTVNFRTIRDSRSIDFESGDVIHGHAGAATDLGGASTPGMQTPKELSNAKNPFGDFNSVTREFADAYA